MPSYRLDHPLVIAHRGASAAAAGNTVAAFTLAVAQDADGIEFDVRRTADGVLVVHHDPTLPDGSVIGALPFAELRTRSAATPTLDEVVDVSGDLLLDIEIKNDPAEPDFDSERGVADAVVAWVRRHELEWRTVITSFDEGTVARVRQVDPSGEVVTGRLVGRVDDLSAVLGEVAAAGHRWVAPHHSALAPDPAVVIDLAHLRSLQVMVWTLDDPQRMRALAAAGVDGIITNDPALANSALT